MSMLESTPCIIDQQEEVHQAMADVLQAYERFHMLLTSKSLQHRR